MKNEQKKKNTKGEVVKKHISAIHIGSKLTQNERKVNNALLFNAYDDLLIKSEHAIEIDTLAQIIGFTGNNTEVLKEAVRGLKKTDVEWDIFNEDGKKEWGTSTLLAGARFVEGVCYYAYYSGLAQKLYNPEMYARINLAVQRNISGGHALALYENCYRFINVGSTGWWSIDDFRKILGIQGLKYAETFKSLNQKIIKPAVQEVNKTSNIIIKPDFKKAGRKVEFIKFSVKENPQATLLDMEEEDQINQTRTYKRLLRKGISKILARNWILEYGEEYIKEKIDIADQFEKRKKMDTSASGFLVEAVKKDYKTEKTEQKKAVKELEEKKQTEDREKLEFEALKNKILMIEKRYRDLGTVRIEAEISKLSEGEAKEIEESFIASLDGAEILIERFRKYGWSSPYLWARTVAFWKTKGMNFPSMENFALENGFPNYNEAKARKKDLEENKNLLV